MARPPARAGGRSGLLTEGKSGKSNGYSLHFPKGHLPTSPARPAGGRAVTGLSLGGPQARYPIRGTASPTQPHQRRESRGKNLFPLGFFPPFLPKKWGPGRVGQGFLPFQRRKEKPTMGPDREGTVPARSNGAGEEPHAAPIPTAMGFKALQSAPSARPAAPPGAPAAPLPHGGTGFPSHFPRQCPRRRRRPPRGRSPGTPSPPR